MDSQPHQSHLARFNEPGFHPGSVATLVRSRSFLTIHDVETAFDIPESGIEERVGADGSRRIVTDCISGDSLNNDLDGTLWPGNGTSGIEIIDQEQEESNLQSRWWNEYLSDSRPCESTTENTDRVSNRRDSIINEAPVVQLSESSLYVSTMAALQLRGTRRGSPQAAALPDIGEVDHNAVNMHWARLLPEATHMAQTTRNTVDEYVLNVDDPRRSYDMSDFMNDWRLQYLTGADVPAFEPGLQRLGRPSKLIMRAEICELGVDVQGLKWQLLGPTRLDASIARRLLHPSRRYRGGETLSELGCRPSVQPKYRRHYRFRAFHPKHIARPSHYQLRNVLSAPSRNEIFYATGSKVMQTSLACPDLKVPVMDLSDTSHTGASVRITCLSTPHGGRRHEYRSDHVLLAGGFCGEYAMLDLTSENPKGYTGGGFVTHDYNGIVNHIHTDSSRRSGLLQATFCSNDRKVRVMDVKTLSFLNVFPYEHAVNCSAISPDGRLRMLVGDSDQVLITNADSGEVLVALEGHSDHVFACAWSPAGHLVATGAQDGKVVLWDARNWSKPLHTFYAIMSCARSLHFTDHAALVIAESEDVVSVCATQDFEQRQDISFFGSIAGVALLDGGAELAVANADRTVGGLLSFQRSSSLIMNDTFSEELSIANGYGQNNYAAAHCDTLGLDVLV